MQPLRHLAFHPDRAPARVLWFREGGDDGAGVGDFGVVNGTSPSPRLVLATQGFTSMTFGAPP
jgi:hypothetical protein